MYASPKSVSNLSPRTDRHTKRGVNVRKDTKRPDRVDFKAYRSVPDDQEVGLGRVWGNMPSPDDLLEWEHDVGSMHSEEEEPDDPGDEGYFLGQPLEAFVSDDENARDALGMVSRPTTPRLAPAAARPRARAWRSTTP